MARNYCLVAFVMVLLDHSVRKKKQPEVPSCTNQCCLETYLIEIFLTKLTNSVLPALSWNEAVNEEAVKRL